MQVKSTKQTEYKEAQGSWHAMQKHELLLVHSTSIFSSTQTIRMQTPQRFASCRGVDFEINPHNDPFSITTPPIQPDFLGKNNARRLSWTQKTSSKIFQSFKRFDSQPSSHFCDLDEDDDDDDDVASLENLEEGNEKDREKPILLRNNSTSEIPVTKAPQKSPAGSRLSIILMDQGLFTVYKQLFVVCLTLNITGLVLAATGHFTYAKKRASMFAIANILALTLCRSEAFLRVVFWLTVKLLGRSWIPVSIKTAVTSLLQSLGGIHSSCGISSIAWLIYSLVITLKNREETSPEIIAVASTILGLLCLSCLAAFPLIRHLHHNVFERTHRFTGWAALALLWSFIILTISYDSKTKSYDSEIGSKLIKQQEFWFTIAITILIMLPWVTMKRVPVRVSASSQHASIIKFEGGIEAGILGRISPSPFSEWHAFGIISDNKTEHMMLAGAVGDFTESLVSNPPTHLWIRQVHFAGLPYLVNMYDRVLVVATGSGICVFLSFLLQPCSANVCVLWVAKGIEQNFGKEIQGWMSGHPKDKVIIHDTVVLGRPNVSQMSVNAARDFGAQVVIVTSNPEGSRDVVNACKDAGIPAFGPIWDS